jgi:hypothetical protein
VVSLSQIGDDSSETVSGNVWGSSAFEISLLSPFKGVCIFSKQMMSLGDELAVMSGSVSVPQQRLQIMTISGIV